MEEGEAPRKSLVDPPREGRLSRPLARDDVKHLGTQHVHLAFYPGLEWF